MASQRDTRTAFYGVDGRADQNGPAFRRSLVGAGPLEVSTDHWIAAALRHRMPPAVRDRVGVSMRLVVYLVLPELALADDLCQGRCLPFYPLCSWLEQLFDRLVRDGLPFEEQADEQSARSLIGQYIAQLPTTQRTLSLADVQVVGPPANWVGHTTPSMVIGQERDNRALADLLCLLPGCFSVASHTDDFDVCSNLMVPERQAASAAPVQALHAATFMRKRLLEHPNPQLQYFVPFNTIVAEIMRRLEPTESERFVPLFDACHLAACVRTLLEHCRNQLPHQGQSCAELWRRSRLASEWRAQ